jgi:DNA repair exonuclease SbcCD ATPase subunit
MADKLIFPIGFDLEKGIQEAQGDADRLLRRLEMQIKSRPLAVNLRINGAGDGSINSINSRIKELVDRWNSLTEAERVASKTSGEYTVEAKKILAEYTRLVGASESYARTLQQISSAARRSANEQEKMTAKQRAAWEKLRRAISANENTIDGLNAKIKAYQQRLNGLEVGSKKFEKTAEKIKRLSIKLDEAKKKVAELTGKMATSAPKQVQAVKLVNQELKNQDGYVSRLLKRMAVYAGYSMIGTFLTNVREVTAQFELQRISLGAIIQDQSRANQLFSEIKTFALKSPIQILDLAKYTKQVAAYGVETDKLFDTTKRIMDISVGLGVDASRLVLAFGQVKAASYLRAAEIRQFTEAGIPMLELLAEKFTELNGKAVTTEQVMDMVSKRMVGFNMVEEIFKDMTSAGGMFFDMQEKQGNTLYGMWAKLGDAASVMYEQIGNTSSVNAGMKDLIQLITDLMKNWRLVGREMVVVVGTLALLRANTVLSTRNTQAAEIATNQYAVAQTRLNAAQKAGSKISASAAKYSAKAAVANRAAAMSTNAWTAAQFKLIAATNSLKAAFLGNWITLTIAAIAAIGAAIYSAYEKAHKLQNELKEIETTGAAESAKSVFNFERLANAAIGAANGSKQQNDALEELKRTYKDIIPAEELSITNLRKMREEGYAPLTAAIKEYIAQRTLQKEIDAITENYTSDIIAKQREVRELLKRGSTYNFFKGVAWSPIDGLDDDQISQVFANVDKIAKDKSKSWQDVWIDAIKGVTNVSEEQEAKMRRLFNNSEQNANQSSYNNKLRDIVDNTRDMANETDAATKKMDEQTGSLGKYGKVLAETNKSLEDLRLTFNGNVVDPNTFLAKQMNNNAHIKAWKDDIVEDLKDAGIDIKSEWFNIIQNLNATNPSQISSINFAPILDAIEAAKDKLGDKYIPLKNAIGKYQELYNGVVPSDRTVSAMRSRLMQIGNNVDKTGNIMNDLQRHLMQSGDSWENYSKSIRDAVANYETQIEEMRKINASIKNGERGFSPLDPSKYTDEEIKKVELLVEALKQLFPFLAPEKSQSSKGGRKSDPRLQTLQEMVQLAEKLNKEYQDWQKKVGSTEALERVRNTYKDTVKYAEKLAKDNGITLPHLEVPTNAKELNEYLKVIQGLMDNKTIKGGKKAAIALGVKMSSNISTEEQQAIEKKIKELADRISRTKTAKEFYDKILSQTGDVELAANLTFSIYGENGEGLEKQMADQVRQIVGDTVVKLPDDIISLDDKIDYKALRKFAIKNEKELGGMYDRLIKIADDGEKGLAKIAEQGAKLLLTYDEIAQKRVNIEQEASDKIRQLREAERVYLESNATKEQKQAYSSRTTKAINGINADKELQLLKLQSRYMRFFSAIHSMSHKEAADMRKQIRDAIQKAFREGKMSVDEFKRELKSVDEAFDKLDRDQGAVMDYLAGGFDGLLDRLRSMADEVTHIGAELQQLGKNGETINELGEIFGSDGKKTGKLDQGQIDFINNILGKFGNKSTGNSFSALLKNCNGQLGEMGSKMGEVGAGMEGMANGSMDALAIVDTIIKAVDSTIRGIAQIRDQLNALRSEDHQLEGGFWDGFEYLENFNQYAASGWEKLKGGDFIGAAADTISSIISIFGTAHTQKVKKLNDQIEEQERLLEDLEYTYSRLEKAMDKAFGVDYISNFKQQQQNLQAQAAAYQKQAQLEREKGKGADEDKIRDFESKYRETMDKIADMQGQIAAQMLGTDLTSAARDFAKAWLDAYKEFGNTADAMSEKFHEMIENMIVESLLARVMEKALQPAFKMIDEYNGDFMDAGFWKEVSALAAQGAEDANYGAQTMMKFLEQAGVNIRDLGGDLTGISRDIATASEESINGLSAHMNTVEYYVAQIHHNVAAMAMRGLDNMPESLPAVDYTPLIQQSLENQSMLVRNTAEAVVECRRSAVAAEATLAEIRRVIVPKGNKGTHYVYVGM